MSHELLRLTAKLCNTPLLVDETYLDKVLSFIEDRNSSKYEAAVVTDKFAPYQRKLNYFPERKLGVVDIHGALTDIPYWGLCGETGVSHQSIREEVEQLIAAGAKTIVLDQDSNGGFAHTVFESAEYIRNLADDNDVKIISYITGNSFSASYVYTAVAHEVIANPSAEAGSIGVRVQLRNTNGYMKKLGIEDTYITAGEGKVPYNADGNFTEDFLSDIKESVNEIYDQFTDHVSMWRGKEKKEVIALGAKTYSTKKALSNGLIDKVMKLDEFKNYIEEVTAEETMAITQLFKKKDKQMSNDVQGATELEQLTSSLEALTTEFTTYKEAAGVEFQALTDKYTAQGEELATALKQLKDIEDQKAELKAQARFDKLEASVGKVKAEKLSKSLSSLNDEDFEEAVAVFKTSHKEKEASFEEEGADGEEVLSEEDLKAQELNHKQQDALDAAIAAQIDKNHKKGAK